MLNNKCLLVIDVSTQPIQSKKIKTLQEAVKTTVSAYNKEYNYERRIPTNWTNEPT